MEKDSKPLRRQNVQVKTGKKSKYSCQTIFTPINTVGEDGTDCLVFV